ncbi:TetR/AcrR family transcriptional regulator [Amycolatopsis anabasis]|uniref:TetR/AcrR family transcriptional regulator n=1 Tax=Amycolatopsis anabasis TaxID=1840409 RepID=UPI00131C2F25|nr:TetR/AcrR family transcriptional regulator [Amycolatopsis anabasis]
MTETKSRRRGAELEQAILDATWAELKEVGYTRLTIEAVAARAATSKPVIYRRWSSRAELVLAAWDRRVPAKRKAPPHTGALRSDLVALFKEVAHRVDSMMSEMIAGVMGETFRHPEVTKVLRKRLCEPSPLTEAIETILGRAADRGELPPVKLPLRVTRLPLDLVRNEFIVYGAPLNEESIVEIVDEVYLPLLRGLGSSPET